jgi:hypothetical protein
MQDEPEARACFQYKMSLERLFPMQDEPEGGKAC